jgi:hypothetical protein
MKQRNISLDLLKFLAVLLVINSHADICYPKYVFLATGGAIGDALFLFCSGFTIFMGRMDRFDNWYKRRINRIYPSVLAFLLYGSIVFSKQISFSSLIFGGGWFVYCIMTYYIFLYFIKRYMSKHLIWAFVLSCIPVIIWYLFEDRSLVFIYKTHPFHFHFSKIVYFLFMLFGAMVGVSQRKVNFHLLSDGLKLGGCIIGFYGYLFLCSKNPIVCQFQLLSLVPLMGITYYFYKITHATQLIALAKTKIIGWIIGAISLLTLEIYMVQFELFTDKMNGIFPLNLLIMFVYIVAVAYVVKVLSRIFSQTFSENKYDWRAVFKLTTD